MQHYVFIAALACPLLGIERNDIVTVPLEPDDGDPVLIVRAVPMDHATVLAAVECGALTPHGAPEPSVELAAAANCPEPVQPPGQPGLRARLRRLQIIR